MSFYIRKALSVGPFRFNLSKSGVGVSAGVTGFRLGSGPAGNYIHAGRHGLYYKKFFSGKKNSDGSKEEIFINDDEGYTEIDSGSVSNMVNSNSKGLLDEINRKLKLTTYTPLLTVLLIILNYFLLTYTWIENQILRNILIGLDILVCGCMVWWVHNFDLIRKTTVLFFELDSDSEANYQAFHDNFSDFMNMDRIWSIEGVTKDDSNWKINAGATNLLDRVVVAPGTGNPKYLTTNIQLPYLPAGKQTLYFLPTMILVYEKNMNRFKVGAVDYDEIKIKSDSTEFIESDSVPKDANIVDTTWRYVNKGGGPDRRYSNNYEIPIAEYGIIHLTTDSGLNENFHSSNVKKAKLLKLAIKAMQTK